jgi:hypothetical protein
VGGRMFMKSREEVGGDEVDEMKKSARMVRAY